MKEQLTPSYHGEKCRHNGSNPDYELACDECDCYLTCMPDWAYLSEHFHNAEDTGWKTIQTSCDEILEAFLNANADKENITDLETQINLEVMKELSNRQYSRGCENLPL